jgi:hypothetical protein
MDEISLYNAPVKRRNFPKEDSRLPKAPPPSTGRLPGKLRGRGAVEEVQYAEGRGNRDATQ